MRRIACENCDVRSSGGLCDLEPEVFEEFRSIGNRLLYHPHQIVYAEGMPCTGLYLVCHGWLKLYHSDRLAHDHILDVVGPGAILGEFAVHEGALHSVSAEVLTETQLTYLPRERLQGFLRRHPASAARLIEILSGELAKARRKLGDLALKSAESRLASLLLQLADDGRGAHGDQPRIRWRRRDLAEMIGVSTETAIRLLSKLKRRGVVRPSGRELVIADLALLTRLAHPGGADA